MPKTMRDANRLIQEAIRLHQSGQLAQAEEIYRRVLRLDGNNADAWHLIGVIALQTGQHELAVESVNKAIALKPTHADFHVNLGSALQAQGKLDEAIGSYRRAIALNPNNHLAYNNWGSTLRTLGRYGEAVGCFEQALRIFPDNPDALTNLGSTLKELNRLDEAVTFLKRSLALNPSSHATCYNLANAYKQQGDLDTAIAYYRRAISIKPEHPESYNHLALCLQAQGKIDLAVQIFRKAIAIRPNFPEGLHNLARILTEQGLLDEALASCREAIQHSPDSPTIHQSLLLFLNYSNMDMAEIFAEHRRWAERHAARHAVDIPPFLNDRDPKRRLRIGYVSPDFRFHAAAFFTEPILANHDKSQVEVFCYAEVAQPDEATARFRQYADHWCSTVGLSDEAVAQLIRSHRIDILIDLAGHTAGSRLMVFARKPAPIQMIYLGYPNTSGLTTMDYRLTDGYVDPPGLTESWYSEKLLRIPEIFICYRPPADMPEIVPLPALRNGYITFGSFNNFVKVNTATIDLWCDVLNALPTARLMIVNVPQGKIWEGLASRFERQGIHRDRLDFYDHVKTGDFRRLHQQADIALDPFPVGGGTTTCEALWMGLPVINMPKDRLIPLSILKNTGLQDFLASTPEEYLHIATHLASNISLLADIRAGLREHLAASPLMDESGFTRKLENIFREVWIKWCGSSA